MKKIKKTSLLVCWLVFVNIAELTYLYSFYKFYQKEYLAVSHESLLIDKIVIMLSYSWSKSLIFFFLYLFLIVVVINLGMYMYRNKYELRNVFMLIFIIYQVSLMFNVYALIFVFLLLIGILINYIITIFSKVRNKTFLIFEINEVVTTIGGFKEPQKLDSIKNNFLNEWEFSKIYELEAEEYLLQNEYFIDLYVNKVIK